MSTTAVFAGVAAANSAAAAEYAHQAKIAECKNSMPSFHAQDASIVEMQGYAECVNEVYPKQLAGNDLIMAKAFFILALVGAGIGVWKASRQYYRDTVDYILLPLMGAIGVPAVALVLLLTIRGIGWLFQ